MSEILNLTKGKKVGFFKDQGKRVKKHWSIAWFILPAFLLAFIFGYIPMTGVLIAFTENFNATRYIDPIEAMSHATWSLRPFQELLQDQVIGSAIANTLIVNVLKIGIVFPATIFLAVLLSEIKTQWVSKMILIVLCLPHFLSWSVVVGIWSGLLDPDVGAINNILGSNVWFFNTDSWFKPLIVFLSMWKGIGWSSILFYAAIMSIDKSFYEAAELDGINKFQKMIKLTLPTIMPTIALMFVMNITYIMDAGFEQVWTMMSLGGPKMYDSQRILGTYIYEKSIAGNTDYSFATAVGVFNGAIALVLMLGGNALVKKTLKTSLW